MVLRFSAFVRQKKLAIPILIFAGSTAGKNKKEVFSMKCSRILALALALLMLCSCTALADNFPLVTEPTTIKIMAQVQAYYPEQNLGNVHGIAKYAELSGVTIEWENVSNSVFNDQLAALIASGDKLPDVIMRGKLSNSKLASWGEEGVIIDLKPYLEEYAPNFWKLYTEEQTISGAITGINGEIWGLPQVILGAEMRTPTKLWLNKKAMDAIGMDDPKTLDDFVKVMTAIRDSDWNGNGEADEVTVIASTGNLHNYFYGSFGLRTRGAHHDTVDVDPETGDLRVYFQSENYRKYLEFMTMMYQEKLIYQEIFTEGDGQSEVFEATDRLSMILNTVAPGNGGDEWYTVNWSLEGPDGFAFHTNTRGAVHSTGNFVITCDCPEELIPVALQWVDYFYTEEGSALALIGVEGEDWEVKADGNRGWTDAAEATRTEEMSANAFRAQYGMWPGGGVPACFFSNLLDAEYGPIPSACAQALLKDYAPEKIWPIITFTSEENEVVSRVGTDINEYAKNFAAQVMTGEVELNDTTWANFQAEIAKMKPETLIEAYRSALTRIYGEGAEF